MGMYKLLIRYNQGEKNQDHPSRYGYSGPGHIMARTRCRRRGFEHWGDDHLHPAPTDT